MNPTNLWYYITSQTPTNSNLWIITVLKRSFVDSICPMVFKRFVCGFESEEKKVHKVRF
jgi:hypothetical protein